LRILVYQSGKDRDVMIAFKPWDVTLLSLLVVSSPSDRGFSGRGLNFNTSRMFHLSPNSVWRSHMYRSIELEGAVCHTQSGVINVSCVSLSGGLPLM
jgi:hypothetical protein